MSEKSPVKIVCWKTILPFFDGGLLVLKAGISFSYTVVQMEICMVRLWQGYLMVKTTVWRMDWIFLFLLVLVRFSGSWFLYKWPYKPCVHIRMKKRPSDWKCKTTFLRKFRKNFFKVTKCREVVPLEESHCTYLPIFYTWLSLVLKWSRVSTI